MALFDGIVIVSDLDGTFLGKNSRIVPENMEKIRYFQQNGGRFTVATGREYILIEHDIPPIGEICNFPAIGCNGSYIIDLKTHEKLREVFLDDRALDQTMLRIVSTFPNVGFRISMKDDNYYLPHMYPGAEWINYYAPERMREVPFDKMPRGGWYKVAFDGPADEIDGAAEMLRQLDERFVSVRASENILEIQPSTGTKGAMLGYMRELIGHGTLWAIGDYENDVAMLKAADRRAVPQNGLPVLKNLPGAVVVCDHDQGAIAGLIDHIESELKA